MYSIETLMMKMGYEKAIVFFIYFGNIFSLLNKKRN